MRDYNTKEGLSKATSTLASFVNIIKERQRAGYDRREHLDEFIVLGRLFLDSCGNCMVDCGFKADEKIDDLEKVLTRDEFWEKIHEYDKATKPNVIKPEKMKSPDFDWESNRDRPYPTSIFFSAKRCLPNPRVFCPVCGRGWAMENIFDCETRSKIESYSFPEFFGKTLRDIKTEYSRFTDAEYCVLSDRPIQNDRYIDLSPYDEKHPDWPKNKKGRVGEKEGITDDYVLQPGDMVYFSRTEFYHKSCKQIKLYCKVEEEFRQALVGAGWKDYWLKAVENKYGSSFYNGPWFEALTPYGTLHLGWRKRVIELKFEHPLIDFKKILSNGVNKDVTVATDYVHCWSYIALKSNLSEILHIVDNYPAVKAFPEHILTGPAHSDTQDICPA